MKKIIIETEFDKIGNLTLKSEEIRKSHLNRLKNLFERSESLNINRESLKLRTKNNKELKLEYDGNLEDLLLEAEIEENTGYEIEEIKELLIILDDNLNKLELELMSAQQKRELEEKKFKETYTDIDIKELELDDPRWIFILNQKSEEEIIIQLEINQLIKKYGNTINVSEDKQNFLRKQADLELWDFDLLDFEF